MGLGKKSRACLRRIADTLAKKPARAHGDLCLLEVVAVASGVDGWVDEDDQAVKLIILEELERLGHPVGKREPDYQGRTDHNDANGHEHPTASRPGHDDNRRAHHKDDESGAQVLGDHEAENHREHPAELHIVADQRDLAVVLGTEGCHEKDSEDLDNLGRLEP